MRSLGAQIGRVLLSNLRPKAALARDGDFVLARNLRMQTRCTSSAGDPSSKFALLKVSNSVFGKGNVLSEEVVEVVRDQRVPDTTGVSQRRQDDQLKEE